MKTIKLYYSTRHENFGDAITPLLLTRLFDCRFHACDYHDAELFAVGSLLQKLAVNRGQAFFSRLLGRYSRELAIWSTGFIAPPESELKLSRKLRVAAVRGKLSLAELERLTGESQKAALGDGGLLMNFLLERRPPVKYAVGIVPHYRDAELKTVGALAERLPNATVINVIGDPLATLQNIAACEFIISSSLHGLVAATALNIPNARLRFSDRLKGNDFKFNDYYSAFDLDSHRTVAPEELLDGRLTMADLAQAYPITPAMVEQLQQGLLAAWPF